MTKTAAEHADARVMPLQARREDATAQPAGTTAATATKPDRKRRVLAVLGLVALLVLGWYSVNWLITGRFIVSTDDAFVKADTSALATKIDGYIAEVPVAENTRVKAGDVVLRIDDGDYRLALAAAENKIASARAGLDRLDQQADAQRAAIDAAKADADRAEADYQRSATLSEQKFASPQALDTARANKERAAATLRSAEAQLGVIAAERREAEAQIAELTTARDRAQRDLDFTTIRAPFDGVIGNRAAEPGQFLKAGSRIMALVPADKAYVEANFKETQISRIRPGAKAEVAVDALGGDSFEGIVVSIAPASGAEFSLLPPDNATGNFTKIVQRVPVRIALPPEAAAKLRPGLSVVVDIDTRTGTTSPGP